ncbi:MAG TPA: hypothetical protein VGJ48_19355 [Pyrinomonadaceae bacterium]
MKTVEMLNRRDMNRRTFCNRVVMTSVGLGLATHDLEGETTKGQTPSLAYPPSKIEGAEQVPAGSFLYFSEPELAWYPMGKDSAYHQAARQ